MRIFATAPIGALGTTSVSANLNTAQVLPDYRASTTLAAVLQIEGSRLVEGKKFTVRASGNCTTAGAYNVTATLLGAVGGTPATSLTPGNWTTLKASTARAVGTITAPWFLEAHLCVDQLSGLLYGTCEHMINNLFDAQAALAAGLSAVDLTTVGPCLSFAVALTFSTGSAGNVGRLYEFCAGW